MRSSTDTTTKTMLVLALLAALAVLLRLGKPAAPACPIGRNSSGTGQYYYYFMFIFVRSAPDRAFFDCPRSSGRTFEHRPFYTWFSYRPWRNAFKPAADGSRTAPSAFFTLWYRHPGGCRT